MVDFFWSKIFPGFGKYFPTKAFIKPDKVQPMVFTKENFLYEDKDDDLSSMKGQNSNICQLFC
jgi:hypothetical protein